MVQQHRRGACRVLVGLGFLTATMGALAAQNECEAKVNLLSVTQKGKDAEVTFRVQTTCAASTGRFEYTLTSSLPGGISSPRRVPSWRAADGQSFDWKDVIPSSGIISNVKVLPSTIMSTKL